MSITRVYQDGRRVITSAQECQAIADKLSSAFRRKLNSYPAWLTAKGQIPLPGKPRIAKAKMRTIELHGGPLDGSSVSVESHGSNETPDTLPLMYKGQAGRYMGGKWVLLEPVAKPAAQPVEPAPIKTAPPLSQRGAWPSPVPKPATMPIMVKKTTLADIPPPPEHLAADCLDAEYLMRYRTLYCIKHGLKPRVTITPQIWVKRLGLLQAEPDGSYTVTEKGEALFLTSDPDVTERYLQSVGA